MARDIEIHRLSGDRGITRPRNGIDDGGAGRGGGGDADGDHVGRCGQGGDVGQCQPPRHQHAGDQRQIGAGAFQVGLEEPVVADPHQNGSHPGTRGQGEARQGEGQQGLHGPDITPGLRHRNFGRLV